MDGPPLTVHFYHEDSDKTVQYPLNPALVTAIQNRGWVIQRKLGEGSISDVFIVKRKEVRAVLLLFGNLPKGPYGGDISAKVNEAAKLPSIFPVVYDVFTLDIPYSRDPAYVAASAKFGSRTIQVIERMVSTLEDTIKDDGALTTDEVNYVRAKLVSFATLLWNKNMTYPDLKLENIGVLPEDDLQIKLIDIEGLQLTRLEGYDPVQAVNNFVAYNLI